MTTHRKPPRPKDPHDRTEDRWIQKEDLQGLAKMGGDFLKKTVASGFEALKEAKEALPKEASHLISRGKEEVIKTFSQETTKNIISFSIEKFFSVAKQYKLEFTIRLAPVKEKEPHN